MLGKSMIWSIHQRADTGHHWSTPPATRKKGLPMSTNSRLKPMTDHVPASPIADGVRIGHVHLKVADLERALSFYCGILGFELMQRRGREAAFISAGGYHHHIGLNTWESLGGKPPAPGTTGLYHVAILYPSEAACLPARLRPERRRALPGPPARGVAGDARRPARHGPPAPRPGEPRRRAVSPTCGNWG